MASYTDLPVTRPLEESPWPTVPVANLAVHSLTFSSVRLDALVLAFEVRVEGSI